MHFPRNSFLAFLKKIIISGDCLLVPGDGGGHGGDELQLEGEDKEGGREGR